MLLFRVNGAKGLGACNSRFIRLPLYFCEVVKNVLVTDSTHENRQGRNAAITIEMIVLFLLLLQL